MPNEPLTTQRGSHDPVRLARRLYDSGKPKAAWGQLWFCVKVIGLGRQDLLAYFSADEVVALAADFKA